jgi:hypothetical protein
MPLRGLLTLPRGRRAPSKRPRLPCYPPKRTTQIFFTLSQHHPSLTLPCSTPAPTGPTLTPPCPTPAPPGPTPAPPGPAPAPPRPRPGPAPAPPRPRFGPASAPPRHRPNPKPPHSHPFSLMLEEDIVFQKAQAEARAPTLMDMWEDIVPWGQMALTALKVRV